MANAADKINMETLFGRLRFLKAFDAMREIRDLIKFQNWIALTTTSNGKAPLFQLNLGYFRQEIARNCAP